MFKFLKQSLLNISISRQLSYFHMKEYGHSRDFIVACIGKCFKFLAPEAALLASFCIPQLSAWCANGVCDTHCCRVSRHFRQIRKTLNQISYADGINFYVFLGKGKNSYKFVILLLQNENLTVIDLFKNARCNNLCFANAGIFRWLSLKMLLRLGKRCMHWRSRGACLNCGKKLSKSWGYLKFCSRLLQISQILKRWEWRSWSNKLKKPETQNYNLKKTFVPHQVVGPGMKRWKILMNII